MTSKSHSGRAKKIFVKARLCWAKVGGAIGTVGGSLGFVAGSLIGGVVGAVGGKLLGNSPKRKALVEAQDQLRFSLSCTVECSIKACEQTIAAINERIRKLRDQSFIDMVMELLWPRRSDLVRSRIISEIRARASELRQHIINTRNMLSSDKPEESGIYASRTIQSEPVFSLRNLGSCQKIYHQKCVRLISLS